MKLYLTGEPCTQQRHCYFVEGETASFIMDCGYQRCYRGDELPHLLPEQIRAARYLFLSHSHENQSGALPYLLANGIQFSRNTPDMTAASSIRQANQGSYDFYLAIHSNASGSGSEGQTRGIIAFYYPTSANGHRAAELFAQNLREIYPLPQLVTTRATTSLGEVRQPRFPSVLLEIGYHDNYEDAQWIENNIDPIAQSLVQSLTAYFGLPFVYPGPARPGTAQTASGGPVNLRSTPAVTGPVIGKIPDGAAVTVLGAYEDWYVISYDGQLGYASRWFIRT